MARIGQRFSPARGRDAKGEICACVPIATDGPAAPARSPGPRFREHETSAVMLMSQFEGLERKAQAGTLYTQEDNVERAKITYNLISLINGVREAMSVLSS